MPSGTVTTHQQVSKIRAFVTFVTHVYSIWWLTCKNTVDAPWNDLQLYKRLIQYEMIDMNTAQSATQAPNRHLWYLTAEMVPLALFRHDVPETERRALADALLDVKQPTLQTPLNQFSAGWGKPKFPSVTISLRTRLCELVGVDSWFTIHLLQLNVYHSFIFQSVNGSLMQHTLLVQPMLQL